MRLLLLFCLAVAVLPAAATAGSSAPLQVVAAENMWGSIAAQLGGNRVQVRSVIVDPATDPHSYEPTPSDARTLAGAKIAIVNGIGYDTWASQLLAADGGGVTTISVGDVLGLGDRRQPAPVVLAAVCHEGRRRDHGRLRPGGSRRRALLRGTEALVRDQGSHALQRAPYRAPPPLCRCAGRIQREHLRTARCEPRSATADPFRLRQGRRRGHRRKREGQGDG